MRNLARPLLSVLLWAAYGRLPFADRLLRATTELEGGQLRSGTLRVVLRKFYDVDLGLYSYGDLATPGVLPRGTQVGRYVSCGPGLRVHMANHPTARLSMHPFFYNPALGLVEANDDVERSRLVIGDDCWIGSNVILTAKATRIGVGAVVGAGSVVTKPVEAFTIVAGNPARVIGHRLSPEVRAWLTKSCYWEWEPSKILEMMRGFEISADWNDEAK